MNDHQRLELREEQYADALLSAGVELDGGTYMQSADQYLIGCLMALASDEQWTAVLAGLKGVISVAMDRDAQTKAATR